MNKRYLFAFYKLFFAALVVFAIAHQANNLSHLGVFRPANYFSFFTIDANILGAVAFLLSGISYLMGKDNKTLQMLRGATTVYMVTTGIVYVILLSGLQESLNTNIPWVNFTLHYLFPVVIFLDWIVDRPRTAISSRRSLQWLAFPAAWLAYSLVRGAIVGWYPYPFLDPSRESYGTIVVVCVVIAVFVILLSLLIARIGRSKG